MYAWDMVLDLPLGRTATPYQSPSGAHIALPDRLKVAGNHKYTFAAFGIERLVDVEPELWDVLIASRKYGQRSEAIRRAVKACIDRRMPGLFEIIDTTDVDDLDSMMETTEKIVFETHKQVGHLE